MDRATKMFRIVIASGHDAVGVDLPTAGRIRDENPAKQWPPFPARKNIHSISTHSERTTHQELFKNLYFYFFFERDLWFHLADSLRQSLVASRASYLSVPTRQLVEEDHINNRRWWQIKAKSETKLLIARAVQQQHIPQLYESTRIMALRFTTLLPLSESDSLILSDRLFLFAFKTFRLPGRTLNTDATFDLKIYVWSSSRKRLLGMEYKTLYLMITACCWTLQRCVSHFILC